MTVTKPESGGYLWRRTTRQTPEGLQIDELALPVSSLWSAPMTSTDVAKHFDMDRKTVAERINAGELPVMRFGSLLRVRLDHCTPSMLAPIVGVGESGESCGISSAKPS